MSGIVGIWNLNGQPVEKPLLEKLSGTLAHRSPDGEGVWIHGPVGLACRLLRVTPEAVAETQPVVHPSGSVLVFDGRLDNREEILAKVSPSLGVGPRSADPDLVMAAYETFGEDFPERLTGDFALGLFDPTRQQLLLARDAIGIRPLYYYHTPNLFLFASEIKALLAHPCISPQPNEDLLADFLLDGSRNGHGMTFFAGVFSLVPGHQVILTRERLGIRRFWDFDPTRQVRFSSFPEYAEAFRAHFERAVRRRLRSSHPVAVSVSGGLDSSSIFCLAETLRQRNPDCHPFILGVSYISPQGSPSDEATYLQEIEREYGISIHRIPEGPAGFLDGSREAVWHIEAPFLDEQWNTTHHLHRTVHYFGVRVLLTGHWADQVLFDQAYLVDLFHRLAWGEIRSHLREFSRWMTDVDPTYFRREFFLDLVKYHVPKGLVPFLRRLRPRQDPPWYTEPLRQRARQRASSQSLIGRDFPSAHARSVYREIRSAHHVQCMEWSNKVGAMHGLETAFPFLDRDLLSFLMAIPGETQTWNGIPRAILREAMRGILPEAIRHRTWKADFSHLVNEGAERDFPELVHRFQSDGMAIKRGYVKADVIRGELERLKNRIRGPNCETAWSLSDLLGLELWLQIFIGNNAPARGGSGLLERGPKARAQGGTE